MCYQVWASNTRWYVSNIGLGWQKFPTILPGQEQSAIVLQGALKIRNVNRCPHYNYLAILGSLDVCTGLCKRAEKGLHSLWSYPLFFQWEAQKRKWQALPILWAQSGHLRFSVEPSWVIPGYTNPSSFSSQAPNTLNTLSFSCSEVNLPSLSISCAWSEPWRQPQDFWSSSTQRARMGSDIWQALRNAGAGPMGWDALGSARLEFYFVTLWKWAESIPGKEWLHPIPKMA